MRVVARLCPNASAQPDVQRAESMLGNEALYLLGTNHCSLTATRAKAFRRVALGTTLVKRPVDHSTQAALRVSPSATRLAGPPSSETDQCRSN